MKKAEDYLLKDSILYTKITFNSEKYLSETEVLKAIKQAQIDAINETSKRWYKFFRVNENDPFLKQVVNELIKEL